MMKKLKFRMKIKSEITELKKSMKEYKNLAKIKEKKLEEVKNDLTSFINKLEKHADIKEEIKSQVRKLIENLSSDKSNTEKQRKSSDNESEFDEEISSSSSDSKSNLSDELQPNNSEKDNKFQNAKDHDNLINRVQGSSSTMPIASDQNIYNVPPPTSIEYYQQKLPEVPPYQQTKPIHNLTSHNILGADSVKEEKSANQTVKTNSDAYADPPKGEALKIGIVNAIKHIKKGENKKKDKNMEKSKDIEEGSKKANKSNCV